MTGDPLAYPDPSWGKIEQADGKITLTTPAIRWTEDDPFLSRSAHVSAHAEDGPSGNPCKEA